MTEDQQQQQLSALLRLKRFEQPPPGYFDKLLQDVHRRQRADLLRRPAWKLMLERVGTFFSEHSMGTMGYGRYASAATAVVVVGLAIFGSNFSGKPGAQPGTPVLAAAQAKPVDLRSGRATTESLLSLDERRIAVAGMPEADSSLGNARLFPSTVRHGTVAMRQPRYVIDVQPVSYEPTQVSF